MTVSKYVFHHSSDIGTLSRPPHMVVYHMRRLAFVLFSIFSGYIGEISLLLLSHSTETRAGLYFSLCAFIKFRLTIFLNASQCSIPGGIRVGKVTDCINLIRCPCSLYNTKYYSTVSMESTMLIPAIFLSGIQVASKQAPMDRTVASAIGRTGIETN